MIELLVKLSYPLADGVRWMPLNVQPLLEQERLRLEREAKDKLGALISGDLAAFVSSRRPQIEEEVNEIYAKLHPNEPLPTGTINLIVRDLADRLVKATGEHFLPKLSYASQQFSFRSPSDHVAQWAPARTLLGAIAEHGRKAVSKKDHLRGHEISERELLEAMNVCDDYILRTRNDSKTVHAAKRELLSLEEILTDDSDDRSKCDRILRLIEGPQQSSSDRQEGNSRSTKSGAPARPTIGGETCESSGGAGVGEPCVQPPERAEASSPGTSQGDSDDAAGQRRLSRQEILDLVRKRFAESRGDLAQVAAEAKRRMRDRIAQRAATSGEDTSPYQSQHSHPKQELSPLAAVALGKRTPELLKAELVTSLSRVVEDYRAAAGELLQIAELQGISYLDDLAEHLDALRPVDLANEFVFANPDLDLKRLLYLPPLEPFKAVLAMYLNADR